MILLPPSSRKWLRAMLLVAGSAGCDADLVHRWSFGDAAGAAPAGTPLADSIGSAVATVQGNGAMFGDGSLTLPGGSGGNLPAGSIAAYLDLPNGIISARPDLTLEFWITPRGSESWQRIFEFGRSSRTHGSGAVTGEIIDTASAPGGFFAWESLMLTLNIGPNFGSQRLRGHRNLQLEGVFDAELAATTSIGTRYHHAVVFENAAGRHGANGCRATWYRDAVFQGSVDLAFRLPQLADVNNWIGRPISSDNRMSAFSLSELRIHDRALSAADVQASFAGGPDAVFTPPVAVDDDATLHPGKKVLIDVRANDTGGPIIGSVEIVTPPASGTATPLASGKVLYHHGGGGLAPDSFSYRIASVGGISNSATVNLTVTDELRIAGTSFNLPPAPPPAAISVVPAFPGANFNGPLCFASPPGDTRRLFVCELIGIVRVIPDVTSAAPASSVFLNLRTAIATPPRTPAETIEVGANAECGLLGLAFHPQFATNGHFYVCYSATKAGSPGFYQRLSRFTVPPAQINAAAPVADAASELILIEQFDEGPNHNGGDLHFGPDGYLYWAVGDEENASDFRLNSQRIDKDFFAGMFRIDVDKKPGNFEPNLHPSVPRDAGVARYSVPADNPWRNATVFQGKTVDPAAVRTEFYAVGLRSPWRFSIDPADGEILLGDVGQASYEEVNKIEIGRNYGWVFREGAHDFPGSNPGWPARPPDFNAIAIDPLYEFSHPGMPGELAFQGYSIIGGLTYRGDRIPSLTGAYIFGDYVAGHIWALKREGGQVTVRRIAGQPNPANFGRDPSNGDILISDYLGGRIMRLVSATPAGTFPGRLGDTGLFADLTDLSPAPGLLPYETNLSFWSDHARKRRWFAIPDDSAAMTWNRDAPWSFPAGQIWVKHFDLETVRGTPASARRIETRVLVRNETGIYGVSYRWNDSQTEATLVDDGGVAFPVPINVAGNSISQEWRIPSRAQCLSCHTPGAGHALSFNTRQLNRVGDIHGHAGNQIELLGLAGYLANPPDGGTWPRHVAPGDESRPLEARVRSYLDVNCAYCHQPGGSGPGWDGRASLSLDQTGIIRGAVASPLQSGDELIVPGESGRSVILSRLAATHGYSRMPPLASSVVDPEGIDLLTRWIDDELSGRPFYDDWRDARFPPGDPQGEKDADPGGDGRSNYEEYLLGSPPLSPSAVIVPDGDGTRLRFLRKRFRTYRVEASGDLGLWQPLLDLDDYSDADRWEQIPIDATEPARFFRLQVAEP